MLNDIGRYDMTTNIDSVEQLKAHLKVIEKDIKKLKIPIIDGVVGLNCCYVGLEAQLFSAHKELFTEGSICVRNLDEQLLSRFEYKIRLGTSNTWVYLQHIKKLHDLLTSDDDDWDDDDDCLEEEDFDDEQEDHPRLHELAIAVASAKGFNGLKNVEQRRGFCSQYLKHNKLEGIGLDVYDLENLADIYLTMAIIPMKVKQLAEDGLSIKDICNELGLTKLKVTRALKTSIADYLQENLDLYYKD